MKATALRKGTIPEPVSREVTDLDRRALDWIARAFVAGRPFDYHFTDTGLVFRVKGGRIWRSVQYIWPGGRAFEISDEEYEQLRYSEYMDAAKELKAAALDYGLPDHIAKAIEDLVAKAARENTDRATAEPRPEAPAVPRRVTAEELDNVPPALQVKAHKKYDFAPELLADPERLKAELSIANARKRKIRAGEPLSEREDERGRMAESFVKQAGRRRTVIPALKAG